jgi:histidinol-phosphate/aromatic aminotransferase/cobyric acid decarboxylase-like protein/SAM-dependent methyltransferase
VTPWYREYFGADYWALAERHETPERTWHEVAELHRMLGGPISSPRIVDLGCGLGRHAIHLAEAGFAVTALDVSEWAIEEARRRAAEAGVDVRWEVVDLLASSAWPFGVVDAAVCMQWFGWGSDADQRRLLARIRRHLVRGGLLVIQHATPAWLADRTSERPAGNGSPTTHHLESTYDATSGRTKGSMRVLVPGGRGRCYHHDVRLYSPVELATLLRQAGFAVERVDAAAAGQSAPGAIWVLARALPAPPPALAVASWGTPAGVRLDLRYAPDEAELLDPSPGALWKELVASTAQVGADLAASYPVDDPYGCERGAETVGRHFGCPVAPHQLTFGAGVTGLLRDLCGLADGGAIAAPELVHPDLEAWAVSQGSDIHLLEEPVTCDRLLAGVESIHPALVHLDRPAFSGQALPLNEVEVVARAASAAGAVVLIDESAAPYLGPAGSAARLVHRVDNLVVLRGFTKAYSMGGLRVGFALASDGVAAAVRELVAPLQVGELALQAALRLLAAGDVFGRLCARVRAVKPAFVQLLEKLGLRAIEGHENVPWVVVHDDDDAASSLLDRCGIRGLWPATVPSVQASPTKLLHLTVPLSRERIALCSELVVRAAAARTGGRA